jgi:ABC-2 type transport system permease protein
MVMAAMGGCWWPSEVMPEWLRETAHIFPTTWAMDAFHAIISFGRGFESVIVPCGVLILFGAAFSWFGARRLRTVAM